MAAKLPPRKHPPPVWPYGQHTGNPLPANVPVTAWSDNPGARPPGPYHLGRWPRRGGIQFHRTLSFFGTGHTKILSFSLQENASIPHPPIGKNGLFTSAINLPMDLTRSQLGKSKIQIKERRKHLTERTSDQYPGTNKNAALKTCLSSQETSTKRRSTDASNAQTPMSNH